MKQLMIPIAMVLFWACGDGKSEAAKALATQEVASAQVIDLQRFDLPLSVAFPDDAPMDADSLDALATWEEEFGHVRVKAGERFNLTIVEDDGDIARLKADLGRDMLRTHTVLEETPDMLMYRQQFPDEDLVFIHFYQVIRTGGHIFVVESASEGRFNEADVRRMAGAVHPLAAA